jgi:hypothetical protein
MTNNGSRWSAFGLVYLFHTWLVIELNIAVVKIAEIANRET